jgi:hypothetical protein
MLTEEQEAALQALRYMHYARIELDGGYPAQIDGETVPGYVLVADVIGAMEPHLFIYRWPDLLDWYRDALDFRREEGDRYTIRDAMWETKPEDIDLTCRGC